MPRSYDHMHATMISRMLRLMRPPFRLRKQCSPQQAPWMSQSTHTRPQSAWLTACLIPTLRLNPLLLWLKFQQPTVMIWSLERHTPARPRAFARRSTLAELTRRHFSRDDHTQASNGLG